MVKIEAIIRPQCIDMVKTALDYVGCARITVSEVRGSGKQECYVQRYRGAEYVIDLLPKIKIEVVAREEDVSCIVQAIVAAARTGQPGDGKIFISPVIEAFRIRTGECGEDAL